MKTALPYTYTHLMLLADAGTCGFIYFTDFICFLISLQFGKPTCKHPLRFTIHLKHLKCEAHINFLNRSCANVVYWYFCGILAMF